MEIDGLESAAETAVRDLASGIVVAGPGAGKTELLAQRACFLFQTGLCPAPERILAISFKRDAASNLRRRVRQRCGPNTARCFDSMTFDSFAKGLLDRFLAGLPKHYRPTWNYQIDLTLDRQQQLMVALHLASGVAPDLVTTLIRSGAEEDFYKRYVIGGRLWGTPRADETESEILAREVWRVLLFEGASSRLNFTMIGRLAELLLRANPKILKALRETYAYVFLDEFQDATRVQYDLTVTAFKDSDAKLTAVGDPKQRIMLWAGALDGVFKQFQGDFQARHHGLAMNYRSAPELVRIQRHLIAALDPEATPPKAHRKEEDGAGECQVFLYSNNVSEAQHLADYLSDIIENENLKPSDVCVLTRTWNEKYSTLLIEELSKKGITARIEKDVQDLLAEPVVKILLNFLRLAVSQRNPQTWSELTEECFELWGIESGTMRARNVERTLAEARKRLANLVNQLDRSKKSVDSVLSEILKIAGEKAIKQSYPQYRQGTYCADIMQQLATEIQDRLSRSMSWPVAIDDLEGVNAIPIMTVHKSKGLEYHTVVFVGLEDSSLWNFRKSPDEEKCGFFVAFSRAIKRVVFTFSEVRPRNTGGVPEKQSRQAIGTLYTLLADAGVHPLMPKPATRTAQQLRR
ncbi:MAG: UvrD-helicase domain-containing protein [Pirellulaceae bacterium]